MIGNLLAAGGVHPNVAQAIMRHSSLNLTMSRYSHILVEQEGDAVTGLPDLAAPARLARCLARCLALSAGKRDLRRILANARTARRRAA